MIETTVCLYINVVYDIELTSMTSIQREYSVVCRVGYTRMVAATGLDSLTSICNHVISPVAIMQGNQPCGGPFASL